MVQAQEIPTGDAVAQHYNDLDLYYREMWGEHLHHGLWESGKESVETAVHRLIDRVASAGGIGSGSRVYDVGAGYGATARYLTENYRARVTAITLSSMQFQYAVSKETASAGPRYVLGDWLETPLEPESCDVVIAIESSEHMDKAAFMAKAFHVLRPGGKLVICAWLAGDALRPWETRYLVEPICREGRLKSMGTRNDYLHWMTGAGFRELQFEDLSRKVKKTWSLCVWRLVKHALTRPEVRNFLLSHANVNRIFAKTVFRIWIAYNTGSMRFGLFSGVKPAVGETARPVSRA